MTLIRLTVDQQKEEDNSQKAFYNNDASFNYVLLLLFMCYIYSFCAILLYIVSFSTIIVYKPPWESFKTGSAWYEMKKINTSTTAQMTATTAGEEAAATEHLMCVLGRTNCVLPTVGPVSILFHNTLMMLKEAGGLSPTASCFSPTAQHEITIKLHST